MRKPGVEPAERVHEEERVDHKRIVDETPEEANVKKLRKDGHELC